MSFMASVPSKDPHDDRHHFTAEDVTRIILNDMVEHLPDANHHSGAHRCQRMTASGECARRLDCSSLRIIR